MKRLLLAALAASMLAAPARAWTQFPFPNTTLLINGGFYGYEGTITGTITFGLAPADLPYLDQMSASIIITFDQVQYDLNVIGAVSAGYEIGIKLQDDPTHSNTDRRDFDLMLINAAPGTILIDSAYTFLPSGIAPGSHTYTEIAWLSDGTLPPDVVPGLVRVYGTATPVASVPEPSTWAMMLLGFAGLGFAFSRSRRKMSFA